MSKAAVSVFIFGVYLIGLGIFMVVIPNFLLRLFSVNTTSEVWIRVAGMLVIFLGVYDFVAARYEMIPFFRWSIYIRASVILFFTTFVLMDFVQPQLIIFGVIDLLGAIWTALALRSTKPLVKPA